MPDSSDAICSGSGVVGWGLSDGSGGFPSGITEADGSGNVLFDISFPDGEAIYRGIKVDASDVDLALLRQTAGWTGMTIPPPPSPPTVTGVSPASGPVGAGTTVTISGSGFSGASSVTFGGRAAVFSVDGSGSIVATSPAGIAPGQVDVVVTAPGGSSAVSPADQFTFAEPPPSPSLRVVSVVSTPDGGGYWLASSDGQVYGFDAGNFGSPAKLGLNKPIVGMASTPDGQGYWLVAADGGVFSYGDAGFYGSRGGQPLNQPIVGIAATPDGQGYWLVAADGGIFGYGDAGFYGSAGSLPLNAPVVGMSASPGGLGYWLVAADGGVFAYGDAPFSGSAGGIHLNKAMVGIAANTDGGGYWLVASDGGVFAYGDAAFHGSAGALPLVAPVVSMAARPDGGGYWLAAADGGVFGYGDAPFLGSAAGT